MTESNSICECQHAEEHHSRATGGCWECWHNQRKNPCYEFRPIPAGFKPIITAPKKAKWIILFTDGGEYIRAHWTKLPIPGWCYDRGGFFDLVRGTPVAWHPDQEQV